MRLFLFSLRPTVIIVMRVSLSIERITLEENPFILTISISLKVLVNINTLIANNNSIHSILTLNHNTNTIEIP